MHKGVALRLHNVAHSVLDGGLEKCTLASLNRSFQPGQFHVVGGPSGAGKTTLLSILSLTVQARSGIVWWGEQNLTAMPADRQNRWQRQHLGLIFQTPRLVGAMNVQGHVRLAASIHGRPEAELEGLSILTALGMGEKLNHSPAQLSGGEKQLVAIAQALCVRPAILLADEPTAMLDQQNAVRVAHIFRAFARDSSAIVVCVSNDRAVIDAADTLLMLEEGPDNELILPTMEGRY